MTVMDLHDSLAAAQAAAVASTLDPYLTGLGLPRITWEVLDHGQIIGHVVSPADAQVYADCAPLLGYLDIDGAYILVAGRWIRVVAS